MNRIIAYTVGSFWYCPTCFHKGNEPGEATTEDHLMACYTYRCDQCGKLIAKRKTGQR